jgi:hypothetical protein
VHVGVNPTACLGGDRAIKQAFTPAYTPILGRHKIMKLQYTGQGKTLHTG